MNILSYIQSKLNLSTTKTKVLSNIYWAVLGKCVNLLGSLFVGILVARYLGAEQYGLMNYVISIVSIFQVFADFGLDSIQIREEAKNKELRDRLIGTTFALKLFFAVIAVALIFVYTVLFEADSLTQSLIFVYSASVILNTTWVARNHFTSIVMNKHVVQTEITRTIVGMIIKVVLLLCHASLIYFILALVFDAVLLASGYLLSYSRTVDSVFKWRFDLHLAAYLIKQSFPLLLSGAAIVVYHRIDQVMIGKILDDSSVGIYSVAVRFVEVLVFMPTIISQTVSPVLVKIQSEDKLRYTRQSQLFMNITVWLCIFAAVLVAFVAYPLVALTFGQQYIMAASVLSIMAFKVIGDALSQTSGQLIIIEKRQKYVSLRNVFGCIVCIGLNLSVIQQYGIYGAAVVAIITIFASGTMANLMIPSYRKFFKMQMQSLIFGWKDLANIREVMR